ncbi:TetR/AcrR family transcriptional regulator [Rhodopseudomonas sp. RCAM05734]|uniref:TetR/AcrR family transcriptional regulator n=1 Tax=Rhodopseudomonas sp. RCAM05734 TaxID=3457549 RepID=UPI004044CE86
MIKNAKPASRKPAVRKAPAKPRRAAEPAVLSPKAYHHGDLRRVLIEAALRLVEEGGPDAVSVREAARRSGVSPGAPFRHFPTRNALMTAVAEEAQRLFRAELAEAIADTPTTDPLARFRALGLAYLRWAIQNPAHFEVISSGKYFTHDQSAEVSADNGELVGMTGRLLAEAAGQGQLRDADLRAIEIAGRAMVYGFARMNIDGHFPRWGIAEAEAGAMAEAILAVFIDGIAKREAAGGPIPQ